MPGLMFKNVMSGENVLLNIFPTDGGHGLPILAEGYMYIDCLWVSGNSKGRDIPPCFWTSASKTAGPRQKKVWQFFHHPKKRPYLSDPDFLRYKGFQLADTAMPYYELLYLPFDKTSGKPQFREQVKTPQSEKKGFVLYYSHQCPFTAKYVPLIENLAKDKGIPFQAIRLNQKTRRKMPHPHLPHTVSFTTEPF